MTLMCFDVKVRTQEMLNSKQCAILGWVNIYQYYKVDT